MVSKVDTVIDPNPLHFLADVAQKEDGSAGGNTSRNPSVAALTKWRTQTNQFLQAGTPLPSIVKELEELVGRATWGQRRGVGITVSDWASEMLLLFMRPATFDDIEAALSRHDVRLPS